MSDQPGVPLTLVVSTNEENWRVCQEQNVWGVREGNSSGLGKAARLEPGDQLAIWISRKGFVAIAEVTEKPQRPWPETVQVPWQDGSNYAMRIPLRTIETFDPPVGVDFDGAFAPALRLNKNSLFAYGQIDDVQVERIRQIARGEATESTPLARAWIVVQASDSHYLDQEGVTYNFPLNIANAKQIEVGDTLMCYRPGTGAGAKRVFGLGLVGSLKEGPSGYRTATYSHYLPLTNPVGFDDLGRDPRGNPQHSISSAPMEFVEEILRREKLSSLREAPQVRTTDESQDRASNVTLADVSKDFATRLRKAGLDYGFRHDDFVRSALVSLATKRFLLLTGLSGSGKTRLGIAIGQWFGMEHEKWLLVPVRPDWTGPDVLLGFENALSEVVHGRLTWIAPDSLTFILKAARDPERPYLLLLDEMNLAHVERYFADVLAGMESDTSIVPNVGEDSRLSNPRYLPFPRNLFVIGTVNIDETTYMFSPKVLDRANTLEFRVMTNDLQVGVSPPAVLEPGPPDLVNRFLLAATTQDDDWERRSEMAAWLQELHAILSAHDREFGHRVFYEALRFGSLLSQAGEGDPLKALDLQVLQKILPRFHGSTREINDPLSTLGAWCWFGPMSGHTPSPSFDPLATPEGDPKLPLSFDKIRRMTRRLRDNHFAGFAE